MAPKKGVIEVQFNWIFILIAGALILGFFGAVIMRSRPIAEDMLAEPILTSMNAIITSTGISTRTAMFVEIPEEKISFSCERFSVGAFSQPIPETNIVFAPSETEGSFLIAWAFDFNIPHHITNFLFITSPDKRYVFLDPSNSQEVQRIYDLIPSHVRKQKFSTQHFSVDGSSETRIVFFSSAGMPSGIQHDVQDGISAIRVDTSSNKVYFYERTDSGIVEKEADYFGDAMLLGAVFSQDFEDYECNVRKIIKKINVVNRVYHRRTARLQQAYPAYCYYVPNHFPHQITSLSASLPQLINSKNLLEQYSRELDKRSCPPVY